MKRRNLCKNCNSELDETHKKIGLCKICVGIELKERKSYFRVSFKIGIVFAAIISALIIFVKANYVGYDGRNFAIFSTTFVFTPEMAKGLFSSIAGITFRTQLITAAVCFIMPFGRFADFEARGDGIASLSIGVMQLLVVTISGPLMIIYSLYRLIRLRKHIKTAETADMYY